MSPTWCPQAPGRPQGPHGESAGLFPNMRKSLTLLPLPLGLRETWISQYKNLAMERAKVGKTSQVQLKYFDALVRWFSRRIDHRRVSQKSRGNTLSVVVRQRTWRTGDVSSSLQVKWLHIFSKLSKRKSILLKDFSWCAFNGNTCKSQLHFSP